MSDFSDRPFVAGSLVGMRAFDVDSLGRLTGPSFGGVFKPGENVATCGGDGTNPASAFVVAQRELRAMTYRMNARAQTGKAPALRPAHVVGGVTCSCGFYAYFDGRNDYAKPGRVSALVEGYGVCTVGERGFRAEKARLVALINVTKPHFWNTWQFHAFFVVWLTILAVANVIQQDWWLAGLDAFLVAANGVGATLAWRSRTSRKSVAALRRNYPDVPVYRTKRAALRAHPLSAPPAPTPETDDNFWTRSAR